MPALIATLPSPDRDIVALRLVAGLSIPNIVGALGVTPAAIRLAEQQAQSALQPAAIANGPPPATRQRVVLLPSARIEPTDTRPTNHRAGRVTGMNQGNSPRQHPTQSDASTRAPAANLQWRDAELALKVARHCFEKWRVTGQADASSGATMHAYHTHTALHEAARVIDMLIETFRVEASALITAPERGADVPTQRG